MRAVVFDIGGVLIDWDPRYLYRRLFDGRDEEMEVFLTEVTTPAWNHQQDAGRAWAEAIDELVREHPDKRELIEAYSERWDEMLGGPIDDSVAILAELRAAGVPLFALSNWSAETFPVAVERFDFLRWFDGRVISGELGVAKPDRRIFEHLLERFGLVPAETYFTDDREENVAAARALGIRSSRFEGAEGLRTELVALGLLP